MPNTHLLELLEMYAEATARVAEIKELVDNVVKQAAETHGIANVAVFMDHLQVAAGLARIREANEKSPESANHAARIAKTLLRAETLGAETLEKWKPHAVTEHKEMLAEFKAGVSRERTASERADVSGRIDVSLRRHLLDHIMRFGFSEELACQGMTEVVRAQPHMSMRVFEENWVRVATPLCTRLKTSLAKQVLAICDKSNDETAYADMSVEALHEWVRQQ